MGWFRAEGGALAAAGRLRHTWGVRLCGTTIVLLLAALTVADPAIAQEAATDPIDLTDDPKPAPKPEEEKKADTFERRERRCGFTFGLTLGGALGGATGFRNDATVIGREEFRGDAGFGGGGAAQGWFGVALADWLVFGLGGGASMLSHADHTTVGWNTVFHVDLVPAYPLGGVWRELGVSVEAGLGDTNTTANADDSAFIESGASSRLAVGVFYEGVRVWNLSSGPFASADFMFSTSAMRPAAVIGWRTAFYGGP